MRQGGLILEAGRVRSKKMKNSKKKNTKTFAPSKTHDEIHSRPAIATTSRRRAMKHVRRVGPHSLAFIDPRFEEIGHVQLSQWVKTTKVTHTQTDGHTDWETNYRIPPFTHLGIERLFALRRKMASVTSLSWPCLIITNIGAIPVTCPVTMDWVHAGHATIV